MIEVIAYLDDNKEWTKADIPAEKLTIINYAFANIVGLEIVRDLKKIHLINELKEAHPHLKTCISIGGWSAGGFSEAVATKETREVLIANLVAYMQKYAFNGIDLDWEYPGMDVAGIASSEEDAKNYLYFVQELRTVLNTLTKETKDDYLLTAAIGAAEELLETMSPDGEYRYIDSLDFVNVMTYDMRGSFTQVAGHHTNLLPYSKREGNLSAEESVNNLIKKGIEPQKIVIGAAFYCRYWTGFPEGTTNPVGVETTTFGGNTYDYNQLKDIFSENPEAIFWDDEAKAPYYFDGDKFISYDDKRSMAAKADYVKERNLRGIMYWEHSLDLTGDLLTAATDRFK